MSYEWIKVLHVLAGTGFIAVHGASMLLLHSIRGERSRHSIKAILEFTAGTTSAMYVTLLGVVGTGAWLGFERSSLFRRGWYWWSLALLLLTTIWMWFVARPFVARLRASCEIRPSGVPRVSNEELGEILASRHSDVIAAVGVGAMALILTLMVIQPRLPEEAPVSVDTTVPPATVAPESSTLPSATVVTSSTVLSADTTLLGETDMFALGWEIFEIKAGGKGCAACHASDGLGTADGPGIIGSSRSEITDALEEVRDMRGIDLTPDEIEAVYQYLRTLP